MNLPEEFQEKYEVNSDVNHILQKGEPLLWKTSRHTWKLDKIGSFSGNSVGRIHSEYEGDYICLIERKNPLTPEEKINLIKKKAKNFVDKHINNPTSNIYEKFELAFLKGDDRGL